jgi:hypothetical protein
LVALANLPALQAAVLRELAASLSSPGVERVALFSSAMMAKLKARIAADTQSDPSTQVEVQVDGSAIQNALDSLREKSFLWKSQRGAYWIEDEQLATWLVQENLNTTN